MQRSYPFRQWKKDVVLWEVSTSVEPARKGGTAKTYTQEQMEGHAHSRLFHHGGVFLYPEGSLDVTGIQHVVYRLGLYLQEHEQEE
eukprot:12920455-Prorocentrum_lima.AAC.1